MAGTKLRVTPEVLVSRANDAQRDISAMDNTLKEIARILRGSKSYWIGEAGDVCRAKYEDQQSEVEDIMKKLKNQPKTLLSMANIYKETEAEAKNASAPLPSDVID